MYSGDALNFGSLCPVPSGLFLFQAVTRKRRFVSLEPLLSQIDLVQCKAVTIDPSTHDAALKTIDKAPLPRPTGGAFSQRLRRVPGIGKARIFVAVAYSG
jgi:hypothetical protein